MNYLQMTLLIIFKLMHKQSIAAYMNMMSGGVNS